MSQIEDPKKRWKLFREISLELWRLRNSTHHGRSVGLRWDRWERTVKQEDAELACQQQAEHKESLEEYLERMMDLLHRPDLREWVRTDWPSKEAEMARLREIYHLRAGSRNTPLHPSQSSTDALRRGAVYNYPTESR